MNIVEKLEWASWFAIVLGLVVMFFSSTWGFIFWSFGLGLSIGAHDELL
jgi:hypothetical protein